MKIRTVAALVAATASLSLMQAGNAQPGVSYHVIDLGVLAGGTLSAAYGVSSNSFVVAGQSTSAGGVVRAFTWTSGGGMVAVAGASGGPIPGSLGVSEVNGTGANGVNNGGFSAGEFNSGGALHPFTTNGGFTDILLPPPGQYPATATGINNAGNVTGHYTFGPDTRPFLYTSGGTAIDLGTAFGYVNFTPTGINQNGDIIAFATDGGGAKHFVKWHPTVVNGTAGSWSDLGKIGGATDAKGYSINDTGTSTGSGVFGGATHAVKNAGVLNTFTDLGTLGGNAIGLDINGVGDVVGVYNQGLVSQRGFVTVSGGVMTDLTGILDGSGVGYTIIDAEGITSAGYIIGSASVGGNIHAVLLTPNPVPAAPVVVLIGASVFGIGIRRNRKKNAAA